jgi:hypothetical protein
MENFPAELISEHTMSMFKTYENSNQTELDYKRVFLWQMQLNGLTPVLTTSSGDIQTTE